jgi:hypothetical protein
VNTIKLTDRALEELRALIHVAPWTKIPTLFREVLEQLEPLDTNGRTTHG